MKRLLLLLLSFTLITSCTNQEKELKAKIIKKEKISVYEVKDVFGERKKNETPISVIIIEYNILSNIEKIGIYKEDGTPISTKKFSYDENKMINGYSYSYSGGFFTEEVYRENGEWFKIIDGRSPIKLDKHYKVRDYTFIDIVTEKTDGTAYFYDISTESKYYGTITERDKFGRWKTFTIDDYFSRIIEREILGTWDY